MDDATDVTRLLRVAGLRATVPRVSTLEVLEQHPHATAKLVGQLVRARIGRVSTQAVYDILDACTQAGLVRRIEPAGSAARYETRTDDNHHHMVCRSCGEVADLDCVVGSQPCLTPSADAGFVLDEAEVVFWGLCQQCQPAEPRTNVPTKARPSKDVSINKDVSTTS